MTLGTLYFRTGGFGRAILNYERALALDRQHPESRANLQIVQDEAGALEMQPDWIDRQLHFASVEQLSITAAVSIWIGIFCIAVRMLARRRRAGMMAMSILSLVISVLAAFAIYRIESGRRGMAIVISQKVEARLATADNAGSVLALPAGSEIKILSRRGDWIYTELPNNLRGWIPASDAEQIRL